MKKQCLVICSIQGTGSLQEGEEKVKQFWNVDLKQHLSNSFPMILEPLEMGQSFDLRRHCQSSKYAILFRLQGSPLS
jgi:hypothetical protein